MSELVTAELMLKQIHLKEVSCYYSKFRKSFERRSSTTIEIFYKSAQFKIY